MVKKNSENRVSGIVLAGGASLRMGFCKSKIRLGGEYLLYSNVTKIKTLFEETLLVVSKRTKLFEALPVRKIRNHFHPTCGPITGLMKGVEECNTPFAFAMACDMPFVNLSIIKRLVEVTRDEDDIIIPNSPDGLEPLFAIYSKRCVPVFREMIGAGDFRIQKSFSRLRVRKIEVDEIVSMDPAGKAFFNINNREDLEKAEKFYEKMGQSGKISKRYTVSS